MKESKLRSIIREEIRDLTESSQYEVSKEYQRIADPAYEAIRDGNPMKGVEHLRSMLHVAEGILLEMEYSDVPQSKINEAQKYVAEARIILKEIYENERRT